MRLLLSLVLAAGAFAQTMPPVFPGGPGPSLSLRQYLDLTNEQVATMVRLTNEFQRFQSEKFRRQAQVSLELSQETRRETLDPMAIGVRFVEMEAIRREITAEQQRITQEVQALLTPAQRTRTQALQDVLRTYPIACEALANNLMSPPADPAAGSQQIGGVGGMIGGILIGSPVCGSIGFRTGDFGGIMPANRISMSVAAEQK
jgi:hypothetical protein